MVVLASDVARHLMYQESNAKPLEQWTTSHLLAQNCNCN
jgi:hypothetical protein